MVLISEGGESLVYGRWDSDMMTRSMEKGDRAAGVCVCVCMCVCVYLCVCVCVVVCVCVCGYLHITTTTLLHSISDFEGVSFFFVWQSCA